MFSLHMKPTQLTHQAFAEMQSVGDDATVFVQILEINDSKARLQCTLSDGGIFLAIYPTHKLHEKLVNKQLKRLDVISINKKDISIVVRSNKQKTFEIKQACLVYDNINSVIGEPIGILEFKKKIMNNEELKKISRKIPLEQKFYIDKISELEQIANNNPQFPQTITVKLKVIDKSEIMAKKNVFFFATFQDANNVIIKGVFFDEAAKVHYHKIQVGFKYLCSNFLMKKAFNKQSGYEMKFTSSSLVLKSLESKIEIEKQKQNMPNNQYERIQKTDKQLVLKSIKEAKGLKRNTQVNILAMVRKIIPIKTNIVLELVNLEGEMIELLIWNQMINVLKVDRLERNKYYLFINTRVNEFKGQNTLNSCKNMLILDKNQAKNEFNIEFPYDKPQFTFRSLAQPPVKLTSIPELLGVTDDEDKQQQYYYVPGILSIYAAFNEARNIFSMFCRNCNDSKGINSQNMLCFDCLSDDTSIKYNLKTSILQEQYALVCKLNEQITQDILGMKAIQAYEVFHQDPFKLKNLIHSVNHQRCLFKVKRKITRFGKFYNIINIYQRIPEMELGILLSKVVDNERVKHSSKKNVLPGLEVYLKQNNIQLEDYDQDYKVQQRQRSPEQQQEILINLSKGQFRTKQELQILQSKIQMHMHTQ